VGEGVYLSIIRADYMCEDENEKFLEVGRRWPEWIEVCCLCVSSFFAQREEAVHNILNEGRLIRSESLRDRPEYLHC